MRNLRTISLFAVACASAALLACSSSSSPAPATTGGDAAADVAADTSTNKDTGTTTDSASSQDTTGTGDDGGGSATCPAPLPSGYACPAPKKPATGTSCTAADVQAYFDACLGTSATDTTCKGYMASNSSCTTCLTGGWLRPDFTLNTAACFVTIDPTATDCAAADECDDDCTNVTCWNMGTCADSTSAQTCTSTVTASGGACYTVANESKLATCRQDPKFKPCDWTQFMADSDLVNFFAGACEFGGNWSASTADAGTDSASDSATADAATGG